MGSHAAIVNPGIFGSPLIVFQMRNKSTVSSIPRGQTVLIATPPNPNGTDSSRMWCVTGKTVYTTGTGINWSSRTGFFVAGVALQTLSPRGDGAIGWAGLITGAQVTGVKNMIRYLVLSQTHTGKLTSGFANSPWADVVATIFRLTNTVNSGSAEVAMKDV